MHHFTDILFHTLYAPHIPEFVHPIDQEISGWPDANISKKREDDIGDTGEMRSAFSSRDRKDQSAKLLLSMSEPNSLDPRGEIFLDKEGRWFHEGVEITHARTLELFSRSICADAGGGYRLQIGRAVTRGLGAGGDPEIGRLSAEEDRESISEVRR